MITTGNASLKSLAVATFLILLAATTSLHALSAEQTPAGMMGAGMMQGQGMMGGMMDMMMGVMGQGEGMMAGMTAQECLSMMGTTRMQNRPPATPGAAG